MKTGEFPPCGFCFVSAGFFFLLGLPALKPLWHRDAAGQLEKKFRNPAIQTPQAASAAVSRAVWPAADHPEAVYRTGVPLPRAARGHSRRTSGAPSYLSLRCRGVRRNTQGTPCSFGDLPRRARYPRGRGAMCAQAAPAWSSCLASRGSRRRRNVYLVAPIGSICWNLTWETNGGQLRRDTRRTKGSDRCRRRMKPTPRLHVDLHATRVALSAELSTALATPNRATAPRGHALAVLGARLVPERVRDGVRHV